MFAPRRTPLTTRRGGYTTSADLRMADVDAFITMGNLAERIGRKRLLLIGARAFGLASALEAWALVALRETAPRG